jgi:hypothetical protein
MDSHDAAGLRRLLRQARASWSWARLDRELAAGSGVEGSEARRLRAERLVCPEERRGIAAALRNILDEAEASSRTGRSSRRDEVRAIVDSRDALLRVIAVLRSDMPLPPSAVARAELLACDRHGPLLSPRGAAAIADELAAIAADMGVTAEPGAP